MIQRKAFHQLEKMKSDGGRYALLIDGARQVGKTFSIREYGKRHFKRIVEINFLRDRDVKGLFENVHNETSFG